MFWGVTLDGGKRYTQTVETSFHVSMAALEPVAKDDPSITSNPMVSVMIQHDKAEFLLCTLQHGQLYQQLLDLNITEGEEVTFFLDGNGIVHLTGYLKEDDKMDSVSLSDFEETEEDEEEEEEGSIDENSSEDIPILEALKDDDDDEEEDEWTPAKAKSLKHKSSTPLTLERKKKKRQKLSAQAKSEESKKGKIKKSNNDEDSEEKIDDDENDEAKENALANENMEHNEDEVIDDDDDESEDDLHLPKISLNMESSDPSTDLSGSFIYNKSIKQEKNILNKVFSANKTKSSKAKKTLADKSKNSINTNGLSSEQKNKQNILDSTEKAQSKKKMEKNKNETSIEKKNENEDHLFEKSNQLLSENVLKKKMHTLQNGVKIKDIKLGNGPIVKHGSLLHVYYTGRLKSNGKVFDSFLEGKPFRFRIGRREVINGWETGLLGMKVGGKRTLIVPPTQGYGSEKIKNIPPNSTLIFDVEVLAVS